MGGQVLHSISEDLKNVESWAEKWVMKLNAKKTQLMTISRKNVTEDTEVSFLGENLKSSNDIKLLGVLINKTLNWSTHVDKIAKRAEQYLGILCKAKKFLEPVGLATLYKTRVRSVMEYCGPVWHGASQGSLSKLDTIQHRACKLLGVNSSICPELNLYSLSHRRNVSGLCQLHRMVSRIAPEDVCDLLPTFVQPSRYSRRVAQSHHL